MSRPHLPRTALLVLLTIGGGARSVSHLDGVEVGSLPVLAVLPVSAGQSSGDRDDSPSPPAGESAETEAISEVVLGIVDGAPVRLVQIGNPARRPPLPDLSRAGSSELPGRVSLEVPPPGLLWDTHWLPPGIYRLSLTSDGFGASLLARPLSPGPEISLPVEVGSMTAPTARFRATLAARRVGKERTGFFSIRWGALVLEAKLTVPPTRALKARPWSMDAVPSLERHGDEIYLGTLTGSDDGGGRLDVRWVRAAGGEERVRLEFTRRRRSLSLSREFAARANRLRTIAEHQIGAGATEGGAETTLAADAYDKRAAQLAKQLAALEGTSREWVGVSRPGVAGDPTVRLDTRGDQVYLVVEFPGGGAEFRLPSASSKPSTP